MSSSIQHCLRGLPLLFACAAFLKADPASVVVMDKPPASGVVVEVTAENTELEPVQARWMSTEDPTKAKRGVSQVFSWTSGGRLIQIGLRADPFDNSLNKGLVAKQSWALDIQELDERQRVKADVATLECDITPSTYKVGKYLVIRPARPVALRQGGRYGFTLRPLSVVDYQRLFLSRTAKDASQLGGLGNQTGGDALKAYHAAQGDYQYDLVFFLAQ